VLDVLRDHGVRATFFLVGNRVEQYPAVVERIAAEGHEIANHTYSHPHLARLGLAEARREIASAERALKLPGTPVARLLRPPFGDFSPRTLLASWRSRNTVVYWSADLKDYRAATPGEILDGLRARPLRSGDILLYHGVTAVAVQALPQVLEAARDGGRRACVTVTEMEA
jgi:peptidoglycan/xylan/chitin deacetylase (PgdA/CDA1 family)